MIKVIGEKEIKAVEELFKLWDDRVDVSEEDKIKLEIENIRGLVNDEWNKLFSPDVPVGFKLQVCDDMCYSRFGQQELPSWSEYVELVNEYNNAKTEEQKYTCYYYLLAIMWEAISVLCD